MEAYCGLIQFISCLYVLPVVPYQMKRVGYDETGSIIATTVCCAIGSIIAAFLTDMPFIIAPPTSVSIFLAVSMQQQGLAKDAGKIFLSIETITVKWQKNQTILLFCTSYYLDFREVTLLHQNIVFV
jgi:xanthine/uracil/vitamin C permease (AzgA family)